MTTDADDPSNRAHIGSSSTRVIGQSRSMCISRRVMGLPSSGLFLSACRAVADSPAMSYLTCSGWWFRIGNVS